MTNEGRQMSDHARLRPLRLRGQLQNRTFPLLKVVCLALGVASVGGCVTFGQFEEGLNSLVGKHEREAYAALGYPSSKQDFSGEVVYIWDRSGTTTSVVPSTTTTSGYVGTTPVTGTTRSNQVVQRAYNCNIKIIVGADSIIKKWEYMGDKAGCSPYMKRLNEYRER